MMNTSTRPAADQRIFEKTIEIQAPASRVWQALTNPDIMKKWMMPDTELEIITEWKVGSPLLIRGNMNGKDFENRGTVLQYEPEQRLQYSHLSSISRLPDRPESYSIIGFKLQPLGERTVLTLTLSNFPNESIYKHLSFYWNVTLEVLKRMIEEQE
jgi:uncharacterized protein YndB with AHSA1/START domain